MGWSTPIDHNINTGLNQPVTVTINSTGADFAAFIVEADYTLTSSFAVTDNKGNTWTASPSYSTGDTWTQIWWMRGGTFGASHQISGAVVGGGNPAYMTVTAACFSGSAASPFDNHNESASVFNATSGQPGGGGITPAGAGELFITGLSLFNTSATAVMIDSGFTITDGNAGGAANYHGLTMAYLIHSGSGNITPTWSWTNNSPWSSPMAAFKAAGGTRSQIHVLGCGMRRPAQRSEPLRRGSFRRRDSGLYVPAHAMAA